MEMILIVAVLAILGHLAVVSYSNYIERGRVSQGVADITTLSMILKQYQCDTDTYPPALTAVGKASKLNPWGRPCRYPNLGEQNAAANSLRDKKRNSLHTDSDPYRLGKDGVSKKQISNKDSLDNVIRANDGAFINLASKFGR